MKQALAFKHEFVEFIPERAAREDDLRLDRICDGVAHVRLRLRKQGGHAAEARRTGSSSFDGKTVSLHPSIGNWGFPCRSHYWIRNNKVQWAEQWSQDRIEAGRAYDRRAKEEYFNAAEGAPQISSSKPETTPARKDAWWKKLWPWW